MNISLRNARIDDLPQIIFLGERLRRESKIWFPEIDTAYLTGVLENQFLRPDKFCCIVAENSSNIVGWLNGLTATYEWSPFRFAAQRVLYVVPEARGFVVARRLIRAFIAWAEANGARRQLLGLGNGIRPEKVDRFYRRLGFEPIGGQYLRDSWASKPS